MVETACEEDRQLLRPQYCLNIGLNMPQYSEYEPCKISKRGDMTVFGSEADHESLLRPDGSPQEQLWETALSWCLHPLPTCCTYYPVQHMYSRVTPGGDEHTRLVRNNHGPTKGPTIFRKIVRTARPIRNTLQGPKSWK